MGGAAVRSMARLNSAHEVRAMADVFLLSEVRARWRLGEVIVVVVVVVVLVLLLLLVPVLVVVVEYYLF